MQEKSSRELFDVILLTGRVVSLSRQEVTRAIVHPRILLTYSALSLTAVAIDQQPWTRGLPLWVQTAIFFLSTAVGLFSAWAVIIALSHVVTRGLVHRMPALISDLTGAFVGLACTYWLLGLYDRPPNLFSVSSVFLYIFYSIIIVHVSIFVWSVLVPPILFHMRSQDGVVTPALQAHATGREKRNTGDLEDENSAPLLKAPPSNGTVVIGGTRIVLQAILHICAQGNYVHIHTAEASHFVAGTMKEVVAQIPANVGLQVHRSHWVAYAAMQSIIRDGRKLKVSLADGAQVPVSRNNSGNVRKLFPVLLANQRSADANR